MRSGSTLWSVTMSLKEFSDTVMIRSSRRATCVCMSTKAYQRRSVSRLYQLSAASISRRRSTVIGWWIVPSTGRPSWRSISEQAVAEALVVLDDVEVVLCGGGGGPRPAWRRRAAPGRCRTRRR